jgi:hypothetical protein
LCEVNYVRKNFFDREKTSQSQKGVRNMGTLRYHCRLYGNFNLTLFSFQAFFYEVC